MQITIFILAIGCAFGCFIVYLVVTLKLIPEAQKKADEAVQELNATANLSPVTAKDVAEIIKALSSLAENLVKAGPALWSLIGSLLFLLIAALAAGLIVSIPETPKKAPGTAQQQATNIDNQANAVGNASNSVQN